MVEVEPGFCGFAERAARVGLDLEPFQRKIAKAALGPERELLILLPRGNGKTSLQALVALHHLLVTEEAEVFCCASSRDQASRTWRSSETTRWTITPGSSGRWRPRVRPSGS